MTATTSDRGERESVDTLLLFFFYTCMLLIALYIHIRISIPDSFKTPIIIITGRDDIVAFFTHEAIPIIRVCKLWIIWLYVYICSDILANSLSLSVDTI